MKKYIKSFLGVFSLFAALFLFNGCNTYKKQLAKFNAFADAHTNELAAKCVQHFPVKDSIGKADTVVRKSNNLNYQSKIDSLQSKSDSLQSQLNKDASDKSNPCASVAASYSKQITGLNNQIKNLQQAYRPCKPDTVKVTQSIYRLDSAKVVVWENRYKVKADSLLIRTQDLKNSNEQSARRLKWNFILGGLLIASVVITILKFVGKF